MSELLNASGIREEVLATHVAGGNKQKVAVGNITTDTIDQEMKDKERANVRRHGSNPPPPHNRPTPATSPPKAERDDGQYVPLMNVPIHVALNEIRKITDFNIKLANWYMAVAEVTIADYHKPSEAEKLWTAELGEDEM